MSFTFSGTVRYSETGPDGRLSLSALVNYLQDCCVLHSNGADLGPEVWAKRGQFWVTTYWRIRIYEYPLFQTPVFVSTWARRYHGFEGDRNLVIKGAKDPEGNEKLYAKVDSRWIFYDFASGKPIRIPQEEIDAYPVEEALEFEKAPRHILLPDGAKAETPFVVHRQDLDTNHHVNNQKYVVFGERYLPEDFVTAELRVEYHKQAKAGDRIIPKVSRLESEIIVSLEDEEGRSYAVLQFLGASSEKLLP